MGSLIDFIFRYRVTAYFLLLQLICVLLISSSNSFYGATFFNSSNAISGAVQTFSQNSIDYFRLKEVNRSLVAENALLRKQLADIISLSPGEELIKNDFEVIPGRIVNKSYRRSVNYMTIAVGEKHGVKQGMGVISANGVIGRVQSTSNGYATVSSILNPTTMISSRISRTNTLCTSQWNGKDFRKTSIKFIPRHLELFQGDTIETSGYNAIYPPGIMIGIVDSVYLKNEEAFYNASAKLTVDFSSLDWVFVIKNDEKKEIDQLEGSINEEP